MSAPTTTPPPVLEGARVLAYAVVDDSVVYTDRSTLYVDGKSLGAVPRLAIGQDLGTQDVLLLFCDEQWHSLGVASHASLKEAQERAEAEYRGVSAKWVHVNVSEEEATQYMVQEQLCSFCGKRPDQIEQMFQSPTARICNECLKALHKRVEPKVQKKTTALKRKAAKAWTRAKAKKKSIPKRKRLS